MSITTISILFILLVILGMPIAYAMGIPCLIYFLFKPGLQSIILLRMFAGFDAYSLIALPLFITMGTVMSTGGITKKLVDFSLIFMGRIKGGLALVNVFASIIFGGISGSSVSDTASIGAILIPEMVRRGYSKKASAGVTVASSTMGGIIPPSVTMIIYSMISYESVGKLFLAGALPGIGIGVLQLIITYFLAAKGNWPTEKINMERKEIAQTILNTLPALAMPVLTVGFIVMGITTATEAAALGLFYAILCGFFVYKELTLKALFQAIKDSIYTSASVMIIIAFSMILQWILTVEGITQKMANFIFSLNMPNISILLLIGLFLLLIGMVMDTGIAVILVTPIFLPTLKVLGVSPIQFGVILIVGLSIGLITPPVGLCLNVASKISGINIIDIFIGAVPWAWANVIIFILVCVFPSFSLLLVNLFY